MEELKIILVTLNHLNEQFHIYNNCINWHFFSQSGESHDMSEGAAYIDPVVESSFLQTTNEASHRLAQTARAAEMTIK